MVVGAALLFGLALGSFANVLIVRVPHGENWVRGSSRCPNCRHDIAWYDNVPLISWLVLRRRCRHCHAAISARYPMVELLVCALVVGAVLVYGATLESLALGYLALISVALVFIDVEVQRLPDVLVLPSYPLLAAILTADALAGGEMGDLRRGGLGLLILGGFYGLMWLAYPSGLGLGDVKSAGLLGLMAGYLGWSNLAVAGIAGPLLGGIAVTVGLATGRLGRRSRVPYGPALFGGAWVGFLFGAVIATGYIGLVTPT